MTVSLKEKNRPLIWVIVAANLLILHSLIQENALRIDGLKALLSLSPRVVPVGLAGVVAVVLNGLLSADLKARLVWFWRRKDVLPGYRAFTYYAKRDPRV